MSDTGGAKTKAPKAERMTLAQAESALAIVDSHLGARPTFNVAADAVALAQQIELQWLLESSRDGSGRISLEERVRAAVRGAAARTVSGPPAARGLVAKQRKAEKDY